MNRVNFQTRRFAAAAATVALVAAAPAHAAAIDVADVVTDIAAQATPIGLVGSAVLMLYAAIKAFKWVRAAMS